ncbi:MAG TPA: hypothetical protein VN345_12685 [Blastocatellia bacterium]|nr:hypothetical protein [Blastocatellia bacterium]
MSPQLLRIHPSEKRVRMLARQHPAAYIAFDLLADEKGSAVSDVPLGSRRPKLEKFAARFLGGTNQIQLSPATTDISKAQSWLRGKSSDLDGVMAKRLDMEYRPGDRSAMEKVKRMKTADCVVGGFRYLANKRVVGSLLLGLYDREGKLDHVGFTSGLKAGDRAPLTKKLESIIKLPGFTGRAPGGPSRWSTERSTEWEPLAPKLVVEVQYDHFTAGAFVMVRGSCDGGRIKRPGNAQWIRWRVAEAGACNGMTSEAKSLSSRKPRVRALGYDR